MNNNNHRELDIGLAQELGHKITLIDLYASEFMESTKYKAPVINYIDKDEYDWLPHYSTDSVDMVELSDEMRLQGWILTVSHLTDGEKFMATYSHLDDFDVGFTCIADTEPMVRALAAYKALTKGKNFYDKQK